MTIQSFFKKVGRGAQRGVGQFTNAAGKAAGGILGGAAAKGLVGYLSAAAPEAAEAAPMLLLKTGGYIRAPRNKEVAAFLHGGERVLPYGVKATKHQKKVIAENKRKQKLGTFY
jgi:hypothetical protein